eukprot:638871-Amorphochlora_amoeboformis.AAC.1
MEREERKQERRGLGSRVIFIGGGQKWGQVVLFQGHAIDVLGQRGGRRFVTYNLRRRRSKKGVGKLVLDCQLNI